MNIPPRARELIENCSALLLDFDGPMAALMPPPKNAEAAERVRRAAAVDLPDDLRTTTDHLAILRHLLDQPDALARAEAEATAAEIDCARTCQPAPWLADLLTDTDARDIPWAVVSNNSALAVLTFLHRHEYSQPTYLACRATNAVDKLKPDPFLLNKALDQVKVLPSRAIFVGDSVSDVKAGKAAHIPVIGYARDSERANQLENEGACVIFAGSNAVRL